MQPNNGCFNRFTYEYVNGKWKIVESQYGYTYQHIPGLGFNAIMDCLDYAPVYNRYKNNSKYTPLQILLVKNLAKDDRLWYKMLIGDSDNYLA